MAEKEYIEREAVLRHRRKMSGADFGGEFWDEAVLCEDIRKIPAADVIEVVRCENCKYIHDPQYGTGYCYPEDSASYRVVSLDDFCKYGKRRDTE